MWQVIEIYNDGMTANFSKFNTKEKALDYLKDEEYEIDEDSSKYGNYDLYPQDLHTAYLINSRNIERKE
ncbi:hypothetical protein JZO86_17315 [Enterococcus ureasiticus]|uniref:hypothetical protein n=1 Tax=Enterococcus ureasiticus TaxID=903984 RepID=UPI001A8C5437|nr:hypothetical protein [Enterococcus ureasiticus]MBO0475425.1 hypothetical protein [Enterococcus ureasiticus]